jgi:hypothetical protein
VRLGCTDAIRALDSDPCSVSALFLPFLALGRYRIRAVLINSKQLFLHLRRKEQEKEVVTLHFVHPYAPSVRYL